MRSANLCSLSQVKQALGLRAGDDKDWKPTSNSRNNEMVKEARKFAQHLKKLHKDISGWTKTMDGERAARETGRCMVIWEGI